MTTAWQWHGAWGLAADRMQRHRQSNHRLSHLVKRSCGPCSAPAWEPAEIPHGKWALNRHMMRRSPDSAGIFFMSAPIVSIGRLPTVEKLLGRRCWVKERCSHQPALYDVSGMQRLVIKPDGQWGCPHTHLVGSRTFRPAWCCFSLYISDGLLALGVFCRSGHPRIRPWPKHPGPIRIDGGLDGALQPASLRTLKTAQYRWCYH